MHIPERPTGGAARPLPPEQAALLAEFGYDARFVRSLARRRGGARRLAGMVALAGHGDLPPRGAGPVPRAAGTHGEVDEGGDGALRGVLSFWLVALPAGALLVGFFLGSIELLARTQGCRGDDDATITPIWVAVLLVVVPFALLDALARWRVRRLLPGTPAPRPGEPRTTPPGLGLRPLPPVLQELACLPILTLIPVVYLQDNVRHPVNGLLLVVAGVLVGGVGIAMALAGGPAFALPLVVVWGAWAWAALHGGGTLATLLLLLATAAVGVPYFARLAGSGPGSGAVAASGESAPS